MTSDIPQPPRSTFGLRGPNGGALDWPAWPRSTDELEALLNDVARSGRWAISGVYTGQESYERRFAAAFADFMDVPYCVPVCNGSAALVIALEALGIGAGDEVLVPGLTWVACASAVVAVGATPILVDVDPETLCMDVSAAHAAITPQTRAIMVVHYLGNPANVEGFRTLAIEHSAVLIEDCSQAHGGQRRGQRLGTFGDVGAFSFQQSKLLTCGEGGAVVTRDPDVYQRLQQLRADGRQWAASRAVGLPELEERGDVQGHNYCMSEFHAAIALEGLSRLDSENIRRRANAQHLHQLIADIPGVTPLHVHSRDDESVYWRFGLRFREQVVARRSAAAIADQLSESLGLDVWQVDRALSHHPLYRPGQTRRRSASLRALLDPRQFTLPVALAAHRTCMSLPHRALLDEHGQMPRIADAIDTAISRRDVADD